MDKGGLPLVTAVVPVYNHERYVVDSIGSILRQSYPNVELIIINDGSKDYSHEAILTLVEECKRRFVRFEYINRGNLGLCATLNQALSMAAGKYFSSLASDDVALPDKFGKLVEALESSDYSVAAAFGNASFIDEHGEKIYLDQIGKVQKVESGRAYSTYLDFHTRQRHVAKAEFGTYHTLISYNYLPAPANLLRTSCIKEVGGWTDGNLLDDWEMWLKLSKRHRLLFVDKIAALYRIHGNNSYDTLKQEIIRACMKLIEKEKDYCACNGFMRAWNDSFYRHLYWMLRYGDLSFKDKLREFKSTEALPFINFVLKTGRTALLQRFSRNAHVFGNQ